MCRHLAYLGPPIGLGELLIGPRGGLYEQSWAPRRQRHGVVNADGFGVGWYPDGEDAPPVRYRRAVPIWTDANLAELAGAIRSRAVLAAVRSATAGTALDEAACAPFRHGRLLLSHNGAVADWTRLPAELGPESGLDAADLLSIEGRSDSGLLWALVRRRIDGGEPLEAALAEVVLQVGALRPQARLNLLASDGSTVTAVRWNETLWYRGGSGCVTVASEPDDEDPQAWQEVPEHTVLSATVAGVRLRPLGATAKE